MKIKIDKIKKFLGKLPLIIAKHSFLACMLLLLLALTLGGFLFYKYYILAEELEPEDLKQFFLLKEGTYQNVLKVWQQQEKMFEDAESKTYPNPFKEPMSVPEEVPEGGEGLTE